MKRISTKRSSALIVLLVGIIALSGCTNTTQATLANQDSATITIFKSPNCGCCSGHAAELQKQGFSVETVGVADTSTIKQKYGVPYNMRSCHTAVAGDYFIEGHVPIEVINKLLEEKPDIDGIALPGMPAGSPGMPGVKKGPFTVYAISNGKTSVYEIV